MASILDVAKEANVSTATVSRVLNGSYSVTKEKRDRVMAAVEKVGYQISDRVRPIAPSPSRQTGDKKLLLAVCSDFLPAILYSFQAAAGRLGYQAICVHYDSRGEYEHLAGLIDSISQKLAGILLLNCADVSPEFQQLVCAYPVAQIGEPLFSRTHNRVVYNDEVQMGEDAAGYFLEKGMKKIGMLAVEPIPHAPLFEKKRLNGYYLAMMDRGLGVDQSLVRFTDMSVEGGFAGCRALLEAHPDLEAVIGMTDAIATGALCALRSMGRTPDELPILSMDDNDGWNFNHGKLPYIDPHHDEMGSTAAHILHAAINGELERDYRVVVRHTLEPFGQPGE